MNEQEYYYNLELLELLEDLVKTMVLYRCQNHFTSKIDNLKERLDKIFDGERK